MTLAQWASCHAEDLLEPLGARWAHVQAVAEQAGRIASAVLPAEERETLIAAAWLHDIGDPLASDHGVSSAGRRALPGRPRRRSPPLLPGGHRSGPTFEAEERGYAAELGTFGREDGPVMDALVYADMTPGRWRLALLSE